MKKVWILESGSFQTYYDSANAAEREASVIRMTGAYRAVVHSANVLSDPIDQTPYIIEKGTLESGEPQAIGRLTLPRLDVDDATWEQIKAHINQAVAFGEAVGAEAYKRELERMLILVDEDGKIHEWPLGYLPIIPSAVPEEG